MMKKWNAPVMVELNINETTCTDDSFWDSLFSGCFPWDKPWKPGHGGGCGGHHDDDEEVTDNLS